MPDMTFETNLGLLQDWADASARSILRRLDDSLSPSVSFIAISPNLLVGTPPKETSTIRDNIHVLGEIDSDTSERAFSLFRKTLERIEKAWALENQEVKSPLDRYKQTSLKEESVGITLETVYNEADGSNSYIYFSGRAVWRKEDRHFVCPVLKLGQRAYESYYRLERPITFNPYSTSLLNLVINQILQACLEGLRSQNADISTFADYARNILTDSARAMMPLGLHRRTRNRRSTNFDVFGDCNSIAALPYESREGRGRILLAERRHPNVRVAISFRKQARLSDHRMARKLLEMSQDELCLLCDSRQIYGLGGITETYDLKREDLFIVEFIRQHSWRLLHGQYEMMTVTLGQPKLPAKRIPEEAFIEHSQRYAPSKERRNLKQIYQIVDAATEQKHGALLVVSDKAVDEARRLGGQSVQVKPFSMTVENVSLLTAIDGAVLIDFSGQCHAVGVILDGRAVKTGTPSRGARFNSALRYVSTMRKEGHRCFAVVISEDGMIDLL